MEHLSDKGIHQPPQYTNRGSVLVSDVPEVMSAGGLTSRALTQLIVLLLQY